MTEPQGRIDLRFIFIRGLLFMKARERCLNRPLFPQRILMTEEKVGLIFAFKDSTPSAAAQGPGTLAGHLQFGTAVV